ncbi:uncharacterized protein LOC104893322 [Beta vulgaris subsp. vulgaris]|uniref:uncharacterized protein LOC104893322 n=1 Tax=Beta vulgaris subsp. vulgaris TaxID=3555 RepID=UPI0005402784|nr:uncharacterized protein LOC104893322 [Beta vulgaris subsp. vulgaris]
MENGNEGAPQSRVDNLGFWNVRGLNSPWKHFDLRNFIQSRNVRLFGYLETRVKTGNFAKVYPRVCPNWSIVTNYSSHYRGRIWLVWSPSYFTVDVKMVTELMIYGVVSHKASRAQFCLSLVYGHNDKEKRSELWNDLIKCSRDVMNTQWVVMGDFNNVLNLNERIGQPNLFSEIERFRNCVDSCGLDDVKMTGPFYTWSNKQQEEDYVATEFDRVLVNGQWECDSERFLSIIEEVWREPTVGTMMFQVASKMKKLKRAFKALNRHYFSNIEIEADAAKKNLDELQLKLKKEEASTAEELVAREVFIRLNKARMSFLAQKAKSHRMNEVQGESAITDAFVEYYQKLLGSANGVRMKIGRRVMNLGASLKQAHQELLCMSFQKEEVKNALFEIGNNKAPSPDGFTNLFFKQAWHIVGAEVTKAVLDFFSGIKMVLPGLINEAQSAFDILRGYNRRNLSPRCTIKVDLQKAYDSIDWGFIQDMMSGLGFPEQFTRWVMECITTPSYTLHVKGGNHGFFKGASGIRKGDPISRLIFVIGMEYLSRLLKKIADKEEFRFHYKCKRPQVNHLIFVDDLMLFCKGNLNSVQLLTQALQHFGQVSGLVANPEKNCHILCIIFMDPNSRGPPGFSKDEEIETIGSNKTTIESSLVVSSKLKLKKQSPPEAKYYADPSHNTSNAISHIEKWSAYVKHKAENPNVCSDYDQKLIVKCSPKP